MAKKDKKTSKGSKASKGKGKKNLPEISAKQKELQAASKDLNEVMSLDPPIKYVGVSREVLINDLARAGAMLTEDETIEMETGLILEQLGIDISKVGISTDEDDEEDSGDDEEEEEDLEDDLDDEDDDSDEDEDEEEDDSGDDDEDDSGDEEEEEEEEDDDEEEEDDDENDWEVKAENALEELDKGEKAETKKVAQELNKVLDLGKDGPKIVVKKRSVLEIASDILQAAQLINPKKDSPEDFSKMAVNWLSKTKAVKWPAKSKKKADKKGKASAKPEKPKKEATKGKGKKPSVNYSRVESFCAALLKNRKKWLIKKQIMDIADGIFVEHGGVSNPKQSNNTQTFLNPLIILKFIKVQDGNDGPTYQLDK